MNDSFLSAKGVYNHDTIRGESHPLHELTEEEVIEIRDLYAQGNISQREIAEQFKVCQQSISKIVRRKTWTHI